MRGDVLGDLLRLAIVEQPEIQRGEAIDESPVAIGNRDRREHERECLADHCLRGVLARQQARRTNAEKKASHNTIVDVITEAMVSEDALSARKANPQRVQSSRSRHSGSPRRLAASREGSQSA